MSKKEQLYHKGILIFELVVCFVILPVSLCFQFSVLWKILAVLIAFAYVLWKAFVAQLIRLFIPKFERIPRFLKVTTLKLLSIAVVTITYVLIMAPEKLFLTVRTNPKQWGVILFVYAFFSVVPQELVYRTYFFSRYKTLFKTQKQFIFCNALLFCLAHLFFMNALVILVTFIGGLLFAFTYLKTRNTYLVSLEHAIYGNWLFTVGMGEMLGFPM